MKHDEDAVTPALRLLRESAAQLQAPPGVEQAVLASFRNRGVHSARPFLAQRWLWAGAAAAAAIAVGWWSIPARPVPALPPVAIRQSPAIAPEIPRTPPVRVILKPVRRKTPKKAPIAPKEELATFIPVPYAPPLHIEDGAQVVRVKLPASSFRMFGIPMNEERQWDRVNADVMLGQDGIVRAVRFVK